ncbi:NAD(P)-dependent oxidoreductase [Brevibacterium marinum]|uniref:Phosphoglycerate dehydrogenase-like enzyme n=1 Tax=Brevibacterium marinum TaxID=418643 RepID=A0A846S215_9MICO|nr:NAD(P)-dependent oxidoreductase [Brevibacterium marinum]NJC57013.1 phosphoglycerate dehydrogenase-like enzyme [Brevibacterium marinum]
MSIKPHLVITAAFDRTRVEELRGHFTVHMVVPSIAGESLSDRGIDELLDIAEVIITELDRVDEATLAKTANLRAVVSCRANPVNVDVAACTSRSIPVLTTPARNAEVTADLAFTLLLMTVRQSSQAERWLRAGNWSADDVFAPYSLFRGIQLSGRTLGILGGGAVGRGVLKRARGFGMSVIVYDPFLPEDAFGDEARVAPLDEVLASSDIITLHVPLMDETVGLLGARELSLIRPDAYLINAARAALIDEEALVKAVTNHELAGVGLDVFWQEPVSSDHPLFSSDIVTATPHIAGASDDVIREHSRIAAEGIAEWREGRRPETLKNPEVWSA